jgi:membrane-bound metal-dependent hydrolase YbcI (DUF457 family)
LYSEHILFSLAFAIVVGTVITYKYNTYLPIWIIAACAWLPDLDYVPHHIGYFITNGVYSPIVHCDSHNIIGIIIMAVGSAYILNKYLKYDFEISAILVTIGTTFHMICDYFVYPSMWKPFSRIFPDVEFKGANLIFEHGSFYGIGEASIILIGIIALMAAITFNYVYYTRYSSNTYTKVSD